MKKEPYERVLHFESPMIFHHSDLETLIDFCDEYYGRGYCQESIYLTTGAARPLMNQMFFFVLKVLSTDIFIIQLLIHFV